MKNEIKRRLGIFVYVLGVLIGLGFNGAVVWADAEASLFDASLSGDEIIESMRCPLMITPGEEGVVTGRFTNTTDLTLKPTIRAHISDGLVTLMREDIRRPELQPGESTTQEYTVSAEDAVWNAFILVRLYMYRLYPLVSRTGSCGILLVHVPLLRGWMVAAGLVVISLLGMGGGLWHWRQVNSPLRSRPLKAAQAMLVLAVFISGGFLLNFLGLWFPAGLLFVATIILVTSLMAYFLML